MASQSLPAFLKGLPSQFPASPFPCRGILLGYGGSSRIPPHDCLASHLLILTSPTQQPQGPLSSALLLLPSSAMVSALPGIFLASGSNVSTCPTPSPGLLLVCWLFQGKVVQLPEGQTIVSSVLQDPQHVSRCPLCIMCPQDVVLLNRGSCHLLSQSMLPVTYYVI